MLSYILSQLEIYFITCIYRTSVAFYESACVRKNARGESARERERVSDPYVCACGAWGFVGLCACCVCVRHIEEAGERKRYETRRDVRRNNFFRSEKRARRGQHATTGGESSERGIVISLPHLFCSSAACLVTTKLIFPWRKYEIFILFVVGEHIYVENDSEL